ncbi:FtsX-like permease family protein [Georgenia faecalis]|uniref:FtsX-like permease family protein n=1 Tax=Georgenia faecalis TaxID=2483799 RepID=A0ABV9D6A2_9MICO|nr:FtsX-like permease family protein [Georgenia faecalis]
MTGLPGLAWRQLRANLAVPLALAVLVLLVAFVVTAWPRVLADVDDRQVAYETDGVSVLRRDVIGVQLGQQPGLPAAPEPGTTGLEPDVEASLGGLLAGLEELRAAQPEPLRGILGEPRATVETPEVDIRPVEGGEIGRPRVSFKSDPYLTDHVELVDGAWPAEPPTADPFAARTPEGMTLTEEELAALQAEADALHARPVQVALSVDAAEVLQWDVGKEREAPGSERTLLLTGTFAPLDPDEDYWGHNPRSAAPYVVDDLNFGTSASAAAYVHPAWDLAPPLPMPMAEPSVRMWFGVDGGALTADAVPEALAQLRGFTAANQPLGESASAEPLSQRFGSELPEVLTRILAQQSVTSTVLAVVAAGPLGVTLAVFLLGARLLVSRCRSSLALLRARGGSGVQLRTMMAAEGLALALPAAAAGAALAIALVPGRTSTGDLALAGGVALVPAALLALATSPRGLREARADLGTSRARLRWVGEVVVLALAAVGVVLLGQRGIQPGDGDTDPLLAAVPLLLALATCVVVMRAYPWPVRALQGALGRRRGVTAFLGAARAVREPAGGLVPAVALVVGVSVALFSAVLGSTVSEGVQGTAWTAVGADLRLSGPVFDAETVGRITGVEGVAAAATVADAGTIGVTAGGQTHRVELVALDPEAFRAVQADAVGIDELPTGLGPVTGDRLPAVLSTSLGAGPGADGVSASIGGSTPLDVVGVMEDVAGAGAAADFVVVDHATAEELTGQVLRPRVLLLAVEAGADPGQVLERVRAIEPDALAENPSADAQNFLASPMAGGMSAALGTAVVLSVLLVLVAVVLTQLMGAPQRARLLAVLRTLGLHRRQGQGIVAWELAPLAVVSVVAGAALGIAVPWVMLGAMDVTALTGGDRQPDLVLDPLVLAAVLGGLLLVAAVAVGVSTMMSRRADLATQLRTGEG